MGELQSAPDALAAGDLTASSGPQLRERLAPLLQAQNRLAAEVARTVRPCELTGAAEHDGSKAVQSWLRGHGHLADAEPDRLAAAADSGVDGCRPVSRSTGVDPRRPNTARWPG